MSIEHPIPWTLERRENPGAPCPVFWQIMDGDGYCVLTEDDEQTATEIYEAVGKLWAYRHNEEEAAEYIRFLKEERAQLLVLVRRLIPAVERYAATLPPHCDIGERLLEEARRVVERGGYGVYGVVPHGPPPAGAALSVEQKLEILREVERYLAEGVEDFAISIGGFELRAGELAKKEKENDKP